MLYWRDSNSGLLLVLTLNREANMIAYTLAKEAKNFASENTWIEMVPSFIEELLLKNVTFSYE